MPPTSEAGLPRADVLGVGISAIDVQDALCLSERLLREHGKGYVCVTGVHGIMEAQSDDGLRAILNRSFLCAPDGMPTVWVGRLQGHRKMRRVYGPDYMLADVPTVGRSSAIVTSCTAETPGLQRNFSIAWNKDSRASRLWEHTLRPSARLSRPRKTNSPRSSVSPVPIFSGLD